MESKRNVDEIIALYDLEDTVRDIYVEGSSDKSFFQWLIGTGTECGSEVYSADDIFVSNDLLDKYSLGHGSNRSRIIAVSRAISEALPEKSNAIFVVDRDFSDYCNEELGSHLLRHTDYNSIELYALNENAVKKLMALAYGRFSPTLPNFYKDMVDILKKLYAIRLTNVLLSWNMSWLDFNKYVKVGDAIDFSEEKYIEAYLNKNSCWSRKEEFYDTLYECKKNLSEDFRLSVRGHDFTVLLMHILNKKIPSRKLDKIDIFEGFVMGLLEKNDLVEENLIREVFEFTKN